MNTRIKIYLGIIAILVVVLICLNVFMKDTQPQQVEEKLPSYAVKKPVIPGEPIDDTVYWPKYRPKPIPQEVLDGAQNNDFYNYLFLNKDKKSLFYSYSEKSQKPQDSETFHNKIQYQLNHVLIYGHYQNFATTVKGAQTYKKDIMNGATLAIPQPAADNSANDKDKNKEEIKNLTPEEKQAQKVVVEKFMDECLKTMCIFNNSTKEYVKIDKRDVKEAIQTLKDFDKWTY